MKARARTAVLPNPDHSWTWLSGNRKIEFGWEDGDPFVLAVDESGLALINADNHDPHTLAQLITVMKMWAC